MKCEECGSIMERLEHNYEQQYDKSLYLTFVCHKCKNYVKEEYKRKEQ